MNSIATARRRSPEAAPQAQTPHGRTPVDADKRALSRAVLSVAAVLIGVHALLAWYLRVPGITTVNDDAWYLLLARSIRDGWYHDSFIVGSPVHSQYPPLYPLFLAICGVLFGDRFDAHLAIGVVLSVLTMVLLFDAIRRLWSPWLALMALALTAVNQHLILGAGQIRSETLFLALSVLSLWAVAAKPEAERQGLAIGAAAAAALTRSLGGTLPIALFLHWISRRRMRTVILLSVIVALTAGMWLAWTVVDPDKSLGSSYIAQVERHVDMARAQDAGLPTRTVRAAVLYFSRYIPYLLPMPTIPGTIVDNVALVAILAVIGAVGLVGMWRRWRAAALYLVVTMALLLVWPWRVGRFVEPLLPLLLLSLVIGATTIGTYVGTRWRFAVPLALTALIGTTAVARDADLVAEWRQCDRSAPMRSRGCYAEDQLSFFALSDYVIANTPDSAKFLVGKAATLGYLTGRKTVLLKPAQMPDSTGLVGYLINNGVTHIVLGNLVTTEFNLTRMLFTVCEHLELERAFPPRTYLFRVRAEGSATRGAAACAALKQAPSKR